MRFAFVIACVAACSPRFDLDEPIAIVVSRELAAYRDVIASAASCWEQEFDIPFVITDRVTDANYVTVVLDDLTCVSLEGGGALSMGRFFAGRPAKISLCPYEVLEQFLNPDYYYFRVVLHELGHASGIFGEGTLPRSVMGSAEHISRGTVVFSEEDHALLEDAVGERTGSCATPVVFGDYLNCRCP